MWICIDDEFLNFVSCDSKCTFGCFLCDMGCCIVGN
jgi:hypothetical protein